MNLKHSVVISYLFIIEHRFWINYPPFPHVLVRILAAVPRTRAPLKTTKALLRERPPHSFVGLGAGPVEAALFALFPALFAAVGTT